MKKVLDYFKSVGKVINKIIVNILLTIVYVLIILPYHILMSNDKEVRWLTYNKTYSQQDFIHMG